MRPSSGALRDLVLVGGGHGHVQVLRRQLMAPIPGLRVTVVVDRPVALYSGMVPGLVAGQYAAEALQIDVQPLARRAGARLIVAAATGIDAVAGEIHLQGRAPLAYDFASLNIGSEVAGLETPGVRAHALATRPIGRLIERLEPAIAAARAHPDRAFRLVIVGGGAGGVELAFCGRERLRAEGLRQVEVTLIDAGPGVLRDRSPAVIRKVEAAARARGIQIEAGVRVAEVQTSAVLLSDGRRLPAELTLWVTGAVAPAWPGESGLPVDARGFIRVRDTLQVEGHDQLFAIGDCAVPAAWPEIPKAGVHAVRQGPVLAENLAALAAGRPLRPHRPQRDFLALLNLGDGTAIGARNGVAAEGRWMWLLKDRIDRAFMRRFQVLDPAGGPTLDFGRGMPELGEMICGGCAAKVGESALTRALAALPPPPADPDVVLGVAQGDDVGAARLGEALVVANLDAFPAFTDDPWLVGLVGVHNALSDLHATGVQPRFAMALVTVPEDEDPERALGQVMAGIRTALDREGVSLLGGHSTVGPQLVVGLSCWGSLPSAAALWPNQGLQVGDLLILSRALGTGILFHADGAGRAAGPWMQAAIARMSRGNGPAARALHGSPSSAVTDVTGFGLAGHLAAMCRKSGVSAELDLAALPLLPGVGHLLARGERSTFHDQNREVAKLISIPPQAARHPALEILFDPQTAGGILLGIAPSAAPAVLAALHLAGEEDATVVGRITAPAEDGALIRCVVAPE